jgi:hypothetical protein
MAKLSRMTVRFGDLDYFADADMYIASYRNSISSIKNLRQAEEFLADEINRTKVESVTDSVVLAYYALNGEFPANDIDVLDVVETSADNSFGENLYHPIKAVKYLTEKGMTNFGPTQTQESIDYYTENGIDEETLSYWKEVMAA